MAPTPSERCGLEGRALQTYLGDLLREQVRVVVTDNTRTLISGRRKLGRLTIRIHHMFLGAPTPVVGAVADHLKGRRRASRRILDDYICENQHRIRLPIAAERRRQVLGRCFDLGEILESLNAEFFEGAFLGTICWGRRSTRRRRRTIRLGSYDYHERLIRIHPALDRLFVPKFFLRWVVFHEMLHQIAPGTERGGRRTFHTDEFKAREQTFPDYERAKQWEREHLKRLILM
jgi:hypothetical protein